MRHIFGKAFIAKVPMEYREQFDRKLSIGNCRRTLIINIICVAFVSQLLALDWIRYSAHELFNSSIHIALFCTHFLILLQIIPLFFIYFRFKQIQQGAYRYGKNITWLTIILLVSAMLPMSILSLIKRDSVAIFAIYAGVVNIVVLLPHRERIILNGMNLLIFVVAIFIIQRDQTELLLMNFAECLALVLPNFIFATYQYNLTVNEFKNKQLLAEQKEIIEAQKQRSDDLLNNILPAQIASELMSTGQVIPRIYANTTILFSDFKGFSQICRQLSAEDLIQDLSYCFSAFDRIIVAHGLERVKTIGDAYMCVAGVPDGMTDHAHRMVNAAVEMQRFLENWKIERLQWGKPIFEARIGIHSGIVTGGVVGTIKFAFDIWGDAVNIASRMESSSMPGRINISHSTHSLIKNDFNCTFRGSLPVKNIGEVDMYFID